MHLFLLLGRLRYKGSLAPKSFRLIWARGTLGLLRDTQKLKLKSFLFTKKCKKQTIHYYNETAAAYTAV